MVNNPEKLDVSSSDFMDMGGTALAGEDMAAPLSDFSKIQELQEIKKVYDESRVKHLSEMQEKDEAIHHLEDDLRIRTDRIRNSSHSNSSNASRKGEAESTAGIYKK